MTLSNGHKLQLGFVVVASAILVAFFQDAWFIALAGVALGFWGGKLIFSK